MKRERESLIVAAQNQSIRANLLKERLTKATEILYGQCVEKYMKVKIILLVVVVTLRRKSKKEAITNLEK